MPYYNKQNEINSLSNKINNYTNDQSFKNNYYEESPKQNQFINNNIEPLKVKIMEKDRIIFEYMKKEKELNQIIYNLNQKIQQISSKNEQNSNLTDFKLNDNNIHMPTNFIATNNNNENSIILKLNEEKNDLINEITRLKFIINNHEDSMKKAFEEINEKNEIINNLENELKQKNNIMNKNDDIKSNLREENKQIPSLKTKINDLEQILKMYQEQMNDLQKNYEVLLNNNRQLQKNINLNKQKEQYYSEKNNNLINKNEQNYKINNLNKELLDKKNEYSKIYEKFICLKNDSDGFIRIFLNELGNFLNYLEMINIENNNEKIFHFENFENWNFQKFEETKLSEGFSLKYEIMYSNINKIKEKIINILNKGNNYWNKINKENIASISEKNTKYNNEKNELNNKINEANNQIKKYENIIEGLNKDYENIKNNYLELKQNYKDFSEKNNFLENNYLNFIKQIENKLSNFPYSINNNEINNNNNKDLNPTQKILLQINSLINFCKELNNRLKQANKFGNDININKNEEIENLKDKIDELTKLLKEKEEIINKYKMNEANLFKINKQLEENLFVQENNFNRGNNNIQEIQKNENVIFPEYICNNDIDREIKLNNILDSLNIKKKINNYCSDIPEYEDSLN